MNILNKNISKVMLGVAVLSTSAMFTSCESDVVDLEPVNVLSDLTAYATAERCELSVVGAYDAIQCGRYSGTSWTRGYPFGGASIMQGEMRGEDMVNVAAFYQYTYEASYNASSTQNNIAFWNASFEAINRINIVLDGEKKALENGVIGQEAYNQYKGELLFLRALCYQELLTHFSEPVNLSNLNKGLGLPIYTTPHTSIPEIEEAMTIKRSSVDDTYKQIISDLDEAETLLPTENPVNNITRASKGASIALKTRVYLHMRDWANVKTEAQKLVTSGTYDLESDPTTPFLSCSNNKESIFSVEASTDDNGSVNGAPFPMFSTRAGARSLITTSPILYNSTYWLQNDKRRVNLQMYNTTTTCYYNDKYRDANRADYCPVIRYAEVLLNYAEADIRTGATEDGLALLNQVRNRSLAAPATEAYKAADFANAKAMMEALIWERRIEFAGEGRRWADIQRLAADDLVPTAGIPAKISYNSISDKKAFGYGVAIPSAYYSTAATFHAYTDRQFLWPVPSEVLLYNKSIEQNDGYK